MSRYGSGESDDEFAAFLFCRLLRHSEVVITKEADRESSPKYLPSGRGKWTQKNVSRVKKIDA